MEQLNLTGYDREKYRQAKARWDAVAKPLDGMGSFEEILSRVAAIQGSDVSRVARSRVIVCCADNGIVEEGISQCGQEVTAICAENIANGKSSVAIMAKQAGVDVLCVDVGIASDKPLAGVRNEKIRRGTRNFLKEPAMTLEETRKAILLGMKLVKESLEQGYEILGIGEMGIGNTTTSSAVTAALLHLPAESVTGRGAGLDDKGLFRKNAVIRQTLQYYGYYTERENLSNEVAKVGIQLDKAEEKNELSQKAETAGERALRILSTVGGLDLACLAGICLGGAKYHVPIVLDGFISLAAALAACRMEPLTREFLIPSHSGKEPAVKAIEGELSLKPVIHAGMAVGEGTGAVMMLQLLKTANAVLEESTSFEAAGIEQYERFEKNTGRKG